MKPIFCFFKQLHEPDSQGGTRRGGGETQLLIAERLRYIKPEKLSEILKLQIEINGLGYNIGHEA